jgi:polysaccharide biosynthesis transport protein
MASFEMMPPQGGYPNPRANGSPAGPSIAPEGQGHYPVQASDEIDLRSLLSTLRREWRLIVAVFASVVLLVGLYTFTQDPVYQAEAVVLVDVQQRGARWSQNSLEDVLRLGGSNRSIENEVAILQQSVPLAERVAARLLESGRPGPLTQPRDEGGSPTVGYVGRYLLAYNVRFGPISDRTDLIRIVAMSTDPAEAARLANYYAEEYTLRSQESSRASIAGSRTFLEEQEHRRREELDAVELQMQEFLMREGAVALDSEGENAVRQLGSLDAQIEETQVELQIERTSLASVEAEIERIQPGLSRRLASGVENEMQQVQAQIAELEIRASDFYAVNPGLRGNEEQNRELQGITTRIREHRARLDQLSDRYVEEVLAVGGVDLRGGAGATGLPYLTELQRDAIARRIRIQGLEAKLGALRQQIRSYEGRLRDIPRQSIQLAQLQRQRQSIAETYLFLVNRLQEARIAEESQLGYVQIIRRADDPWRPVRPRKTLNLAVGLLLGLMGGIGVALLRRALDHRVGSADDLRQHGFSVLGTMPDSAALVKKHFAGEELVELGGRQVYSILALALHPRSPVQEAARHIRTSIRFSLPDREIRVLAVSSALESEGKSTNALTLALSMAQAGMRTLYVDADLRKPTGHSRLGLPRTRGLSELLFHPGAIDWESYRYRLVAGWEDFEERVDDLYVLTAGKEVPSPAELLGSNRMRELVAQMREAFDVVVIDTPPVLAVADSTLVAYHCDAAALVVAAGRTSRDALQDASDRLGTTGTPVIGVILNRARGSKYGGYGYGYGYGAAPTFKLSGDGSDTPHVTVAPRQL